MMKRVVLFVVSAAAAFAPSSGTTSNLYSVWGTSATNVVAVGAGGVTLRRQ